MASLGITSIGGLVDNEVLDDSLDEALGLDE
jgi:hypothetical protein